MQKIKLNIGTIISIILLTIVIGANIYNASKVKAIKDEYDKIQQLNSELNESLGNEEAAYIKFKNANEKNKSKNEELLLKILPEEEKLTDLNREIENYTNTINTSSSPLLLEKITYGESKEDKANKGLYNVPFSMTFEGTENNLKQMIKYFEISGNLEDQNRLIKLTKIQVNLADNSGSKSKVKMIDFKLEGNAYFYKNI